jgi:cytoskeleton-associated protein 5
MDVLVGLDSKQPKVVAGSVSCLKDIVESVSLVEYGDKLSQRRPFGVPALGNIKPLLKALTKIFAHSDKTVRAEGNSLVLVLYTYLGAALLPSLAELKPVQMTELQRSFDSMDGEGRGANTGKPTRWTRKAQREREAAQDVGGAGEGEGPVEEESAPIDPRSLLDPVDVLSKFPSDLEESLASTKWKDRLKALEECNKVLSQPQNARILESNIDAYGPLAQALGAKCKSDANVNVVIEAAKVLEGLARGIGKPFGRFRAMIMPGCLDRLKERKATVVEALGKALDAVFSTVSLMHSVCTRSFADHPLRYSRRSSGPSQIEKPTSPRRNPQISPPITANYPRCSKQGSGQAPRRVTGGCARRLSRVGQNIGSRVPGDDDEDPRRTGVQPVRRERRGIADGQGEGCVFEGGDQVPRRC